ncbi:MAG: TonB-dependent receptor [Rhodocyclales bacterium]|nr:TonB-dependent receptor [Rhodocyclales bacterium]
MSMSLEELMNVEVISASRYGQRLADVPAPIYVITQEDIQRSGARSIPEVLRLAPGVDMAQVNTDRWAGSMRSFTDVLSDRLAILVDGRSLYNPTFSAGFWNILQIPLANIERIEIIRGSGGSNWGFNAINGVINVITRHASTLTGTTVTLGYGSQGGPSSLIQQGQMLNEESWLYTHLQTESRNTLTTTDGQSARDDYRHMNAGFRLDAKDGPRTWMLSGLAYRLHSNGVYNSHTQPTLQTQDFFTDFLSGVNLHGRYREVLDHQSEIELNLSFLSNRFDADTLAQETQQGIDIELQHTIRTEGKHTLLWGLSLQEFSDKSKSGSLVRFSREEENLNVLSLFAQDEFSLAKNLKLTLGSRLDQQTHNPPALQPSARLQWLPTPSQNLWAALSQGRRFPSRLERVAQYSSGLYPNSTPGQLPYRVTTYGAKTIQTEKLASLELGFRQQLTPEFLIDIVSYANHYTNLRTQVQSGEPQVVNGTYLDIPLQSINRGELRTQGLELASEWRPKDNWRLQLSHSLSHTGPLREGDISSNSYYPKQIVSLRTSWTPHARIQLDGWIRHVTSRGNAEHQQLPAYTSLDLRGAWQLNQHIEASVVGQNLLQSHHTEFLAVTPALISSQISRSIMGYLKLSY